MDTFCNACKVNCTACGVHAKVGDTMVESNSIVQYFIRLEGISISSYRFCPRSLGSIGVTLHSYQFHNVVIGRKQRFANAEAFRDVIYLLSLIGLFQYKFKKNAYKQMSVACVVPACP